MKLNGRKIEGPNVEVIVIPRSDGDLIFKAQAVLDWEPFNALCPTPKPPTKLVRGESAPTPAYDHPKYREAMQQYAAKQANWMILESLKATPGLEWETVKVENPETWGNYTKEWSEAGLTQSEQARIVNAVAGVNGMNEKLFEEAKKRFLASQEEAAKSRSLPDAPTSTQSSVPANGSASSLLV